MYYSVIGILALLVLVIENTDILLNLNNSFNYGTWKYYRKFLYAVLVYYATDILWGIFAGVKLHTHLFIDTEIYFIAMAVGILLWTKSASIYLDKNHRFGIFVVYAGRIIATFVTLLTIINIFRPILFIVSDECKYYAYPLRYLVLALQILVLVMMSIFAFATIILKRKELERDKKQRYYTVAFFGLIMAVFLVLQLLFPLLPFYSIAYMLGTCMIRSIVIREEMYKFKKEIEEQEKTAEP